MNTLFLASSKVLPSVLLPAYDLTVALRHQPMPVTGGFHTSLERECLEILLRGTVPVTICPARTFDPASDRLYNDHPKVWKAVKGGMAEGRVTILEPPGMAARRPTKASSARRNDWLLEQAGAVLLLYASPGGETERLVQAALERGLPVSVLDHPANARWHDLGARVWQGSSTRMTPTKMGGDCRGGSPGCCP